MPAVARKMTDCDESCKEFDEGNDENQGRLEDHGKDLMRYTSHH